MTLLVRAAMAASKLWGELMMLCSLKACSAIQTESKPSSAPLKDVLVDFHVGAAHRVWVGLVLVVVLLVQLRALPHEKGSEFHSC